MTLENALRQLLIAEQEAAISMPGETEALTLWRRHTAIPKLRTLTTVGQFIDFLHYDCEDDDFSHIHSQLTQALELASK